MQERKKFRIKTEPLPQQKEMIDRLVKKKACILVGKTGIGKSYCALSKFVHHYNKNHVDTMIVFAPKNAYDKGVWKEELQRHTDIPYIDIETFSTKVGLNQSKIQLFLQKYPVIVAKHTHVHIYADLIKLVQISSRCMVCYDELHKFKNVSSRLTVAMRLATSKAFVRLGLTACLVKGERILTDKGYVKAENVGVGDTIIVDGAPKKVTGFLDNGVKPCYKITTELGNTIKCTYNHPIYVNGTFKPAEEVKVGDKVVVQLHECRDVEVGEIQLPYVGRCFNKVEKLKTDFNLGAILGWLTGDGYVESKSYRIGWMFAEHEIEIMEDIKERLNSIGIHPHVFRREKFNDKREDIDSDNLKPITTLRFGSKQFSQWLKSNGYGKASAKRVPDFLFTASKECKIGYLRYLFGSDGHYCFYRDTRIRRSIVLSSVSESLCKDVQLLLGSMGILSKIYFQPKVEDRKRSSDKYTLSIRVRYIKKFLNEVGMLSTKAGKVDREIVDSMEISNDMEIEDRVKSIEFIGEIQTYGHEVEDHVYITGGIKTHNTPLSKDMKDCYNLINFIYPWYLGTFEMFKKEFCLVRSKVIGRSINGGLKKVEEIVGIASEQALIQRLYPIVVTSESHHSLNWHYIDYEMDAFERSIYRRLSLGIFSSTVELDEDWFRRVITQDVEVTNYSVKEVTRHASRFLYLQFAANGIISEDGSIGTRRGTKVNKALEVLETIFSKKESVVIYCEYYASLRVLMDAVREKFPSVKILEASGKVALKEGFISEAAVKQRSHALFITKAGSESSSLYYINHVMMFECPTLPSAFVQSVGRINRVNTLFPGDLHAHIFRSENIDLYKLMIVCKKTALSELVVNKESNVPEEYKDIAKQMDDVSILKKYLIWHQDQSDKLSNLMQVE